MRRRQGYGCPRQGCRRIRHRLRQQNAQRHQRGQRRDRLQRPPRGAAGRRVEHPGRNPPWSGNVDIDETTPRPGTALPFDHLMNADQPPSPRMPGLGDSHLVTRCRTMGLVLWDCTTTNTAIARSGSSRPTPGTQAKTTLSSSAGRSSTPKLAPPTPPGGHDRSETGPPSATSASIPSATSATTKSETLPNRHRTTPLTNTGRYCARWLSPGVASRPATRSPRPSRRPQPTGTPTGTPSTGDSGAGIARAASPASRSCPRPHNLPDEPLKSLRCDDYRNPAPEDRAGIGRPITWVRAASKLCSDATESA